MGKKKRYVCTKVNQRTVCDELSTKMTIECRFLRYASFWYQAME